MEMNFASKGVAGTGLGLGIAGTALGLMGGGLRNVLGGITAPPASNCCSNNSDAATLAAVSTMMGTIANIATRDSDCNGIPVTRYDAAQAARIAELETEVKLRDANTYTDSKILDLYRYVDGKFACVEAQIGQQAVYNATNNATIGCLSGQVAQLMALTKTVIPITNVCPQPAVATTTA